MSEEIELSSDSDVECPEESNPFVPMHSGAILAVLFVGALYACLVCSMAVYHSIDGGISLLAVAVSSVWLIFWTFYPFIAYKPSYGWCHPLILLAFLGIANMVPRSTGLFMNGLPDHIMLPEWSSAELNWLFAYGNFVNSLALIAIYVGFSVGPRLPVPSLRAAADAPPRLYVFLFIFLGISLIAFWFYVQLFGGLSSHLKSLAFGIAKRIDLAGDVEGLGQYTMLMDMATVTAIIWACAQPNALRNPMFWIVMMSSLILAYLGDGKRSSMILPAILILLCWMLRNRRVPYLRLFLIGGGAFLLLGLLGLVRSSNWSDTEHLNLDAFHETSMAEMGALSVNELSRRSGSEATFFPILAKVPQKEALLYGRTYLEWGLRFIPRQLWPDKPRGVDVQANLTFNGADWGMPAGPVGEAYWNFHLPGVLVIFFLLGMFKKWLAEVLSDYPNAPGVMALYMISVFYFDPSQNGFRTWIFAILPALLMIWLGGLLGGKQRATHTISTSISSPSHVA